MNKLESRPIAKWPLFVIILLLCSTARAHSDELINIDPSDWPGTYYRIVLDRNGDYVMGQGDGYGGGTWYYYPATGWWRQWFYNEPYDPDRQGYLHYHVFITANDYSKQVSFDVHFNWTTAEWSRLGRSRPPLPSDAPTASDEAKYMDDEEFQSLDGVFLGSPESPGSVEPNKSYTIRQYNPEWVSIDIRGKNVDIHRGIIHECRGKQGACYNRTTLTCTMQYQADCTAPNEWLGSGSSCSNAQQKSQSDFGDAPDTYGTTLANNGARHFISAGVYLGTKADSESDGRPSASATGDDDDRDDEDGVQFTSELSPGETATVDVTASVTGYLNAWVDFDRDGTFSSRDDQIFTDTKLTSGVNHLSFRIPANASVADTYARFRFNTRGLLPFNGPAQDGEVEDYKVSITPTRGYEPQANSGKGGLKWSQPAQNSDAATPFILNGWDEVSSLHLHQISADDWQCTDQRPVTGFQWWGSFEGWTKPLLPASLPLAFHIGIWTDAPGREDSNHPDTLIWETYCTHWTWSLAGQDDDPRGINRGETCFQFTCLLSQDQWFYQNPATGADGKAVPTVYWLSIAAVYDTDAPVPANAWGWTTRTHSFNDAAVRIGQVGVGDSRDASWPPAIGARWLAGESVEYPKDTKWDLAFELLTNQGGNNGGDQGGQPPTGADLAPVYRFWSASFNTHFYTINQSEKDALIRDFANVWTYEGIVFYAYPPDHQPVGTKPVYRFWSTSAGRHYYTMNDSEKRRLEDQPGAWTFEGVAWNAFEQPPRE